METLLIASGIFYIFLALVLTVILIYEAYDMYTDPLFSHFDHLMVLLYTVGIAFIGMLVVTGFYLINNSAVL